MRGLLREGAAWTCGRCAVTAEGPAAAFLTGRSAGRPAPRRPRSSTGTPGARSTSVRGRRWTSAHSRRSSVPRSSSTPPSEKRSQSERIRLEVRCRRVVPRGEAGPGGPIAGASRVQSVRARRRSRYRHLRTRGRLVYRVLTRSFRVGPIREAEPRGPRVAAEVSVKADRSEPAVRRAPRSRTARRHGSLAEAGSQRCVTGR